MCKWYADQDNLSFVEGNAENLPFDDESFDLVYNVESSHCYGDMGAFIEQVHRCFGKEVRSVGQIFVILKLCLSYPGNIRITGI